MLKRLSTGVHMLQVFPKYFAVSGGHALMLNACVSLFET